MKKLLLIVIFVLFSLNLKPENNNINKSLKLTKDEIFNDLNNNIKEKLFKILLINQDNNIKITNFKPSKYTDNDEYNFFVKINDKNVLLNSYKNQENVYYIAYDEEHNIAYVILYPDHVILIFY